MNKQMTTSSNGGGMPQDPGNQMHETNKPTPSSGALHTIIVGAGVTGLTAGFYLKRTYGIDNVLILEAEDRPGGNICTTEDDGFLIEHGPNGFLDNVPETLTLAEDLELAPVRSNDNSRKRYLICREKPVRVPGGAVSFMKSPLLSFRGRLRVFAEPFARKKPPGDETVFHFASRRIGGEAASQLVDTMVKGVFAGDSHVLSLKSAFPKMASMEARYGSLVKAMLAKMWKRATGHKDAAAGGPAGPGGTLTSFQGGLSELINALCSHLSGQIKTGCRASDLSHENGLFHITTKNGENYTAHNVLLAVPAASAAYILDHFEPAAAGLLRHTPSAPVAVAAIAFARKDFPCPLDGFGFLVPESEKSALLGSLWTSSIFPARAPDNHVLLRSMLGGLRNPGAVLWPEEKLVETTLSELRRFLGKVPEPARRWIYRYPEGISQYPPGHEDRLKALEMVTGRIPGLFLAGNSFRGISVNLCIVQAREVADKLGAR